MAINRSDPVVRIEILDGKLFAAEQEEIRSRLLSFKFSDAERKMDKAELVFDNHDLLFFDAPVFRKGTVISVEWGYGGRRSPARKLLVKSIKGTPSRVTVECRSPAYLMAVKRKSRTFSDVAVSDVVRIIALENGFSEQSWTIQQTETVLESIVQARESDAAFLTRLARREGFEFWIDYQGLFFIERPLGQRPVRRIEWVGPGEGDIIGEPSITNDILGLHTTVKVKGRDPAAGKKTEAAASNSTDRERKGLAEVTEQVEDPDDGSTERVNLETGAIYRTPPKKVTAGLLTDAEIDRRSPAPISEAVFRTQRRNEEIDRRTPSPISEVVYNALASTPPESRVGESDTDADPRRGKGKRAKAKFRRGVRRAVKMTVKIVGDPLVAAKTVVEIVGMGKRLSQRYYVKESVHEFGSGGYTTTLKLVSDGHGGHSTKGTGAIDLGKLASTPRKSPRGGARDELGDIIAELAALVSVQRATRGGEELLILEQQVGYAKSLYRKDGDAARGVVVSAVRTSESWAKRNGDSTIQTVAASILQVLDLRSQEETKSAAVINEDTEVRDSDELDAVTEVEDGKPVILYKTPKPKIGQ
jgi:phage protein D